MPYIWFNALVSLSSTFNKELHNFILHIALQIMYQVLAGDKAGYRQSIELLNTTPQPPTQTNGKQNKIATN